ncbi:unnamed protein product [Caenorhabditis bovis]|uniref:Uncharacterized protein n=1 Tax=Caenorhabditis bovis TaxID=2654633 RepID=A0A8S1EHM6_9PELO|nr:unnamed protein product [Caenorhabditis bovis]
MFAVIILGWVSFFLIYGAFKGSKMCLIPFVILQLVFLVYDLILIILFIIAIFIPHIFISTIIRMPLDELYIATDYSLMTCCFMMVLLVGPLLWSTHVVYIDFLFISQLDETLNLMKEVHQKVSQDEISPNRMIF